MRRRFPSLLLLALTLAAAPAAHGCPVCDTSTGVQVRGRIFADDFKVNVAAVLAPFPVLVGLVLAIHFGMRPPATWQRSRRNGN